MLELTVACVEPAAQLLGRRLPRPVRSSRLLHPRFWRNEGHSLKAASWWPAYLESVRQIPQSRTRNVAKTAPKAAPRPAQYGSRSFSRYSCVASAGPELGVDEGREIREEQEWEQDDGLQQQSQNEVLQTWQPAVLAQQDELDPDLEHLLNLLGPDPKPDLAQRRRDKAWDIWVSLPDQERFASPMLKKFSQATHAADLDRAMQAYSIIPQDERTVDDYSSAVSVTIARHRYHHAFRACDEAIARGKGLEPAQTLLLCCLRQRLWKNAARAWRSFFVDKRHNDLDWSVLDNEPELVLLTTKLLKRLNAADVVLAADIPTLRQLASVLVTRIAASTRMMAVITQEGILQVYHLSKAIGISKPTHFTLALSNLCHTLRDRLRVDLALLIYRTFRANFPRLSEGVFIGLLRLCSQAKSTPETFDYIMKQYQEFHVPQTKAYNIAMMSMAREANVDEVERYFDDYKRTTARPVELPVLVPRLYVHAITGDVVQTKHALSQIRDEYGLEPDIVCWNILLYAHCRSPQPHGAFEAFDEMISRGIQPDVYTFGTLTAVASNSGDTSRVLSLIDLAGQYGIPRHGDMVASVVHSLCLNGRGQDAWDFAEQATRGGVHGSAVRIWNNLLRHYAFLTDERSVAQIQKTMQQLGVKPDAMTYAALMTSLVRKSRTEQALYLIRRSHLQGKVVANAFHYSILIHGFAMEKNRDMVLTLYREMEDRFPRISPSARLAMLYSQVHRDWDNNLHKIVTSPMQPNDATLSLPNVETAVKDSVLDTSIADMMTKDPQPGFRRRSPQSALASISTEVLIDTFMADAQVEKSVQVMNTVLPTSQRSRPEISSQPESIELLTTRMFVAIHDQDWRAVDTIWSTILTSAIKKGLALNAPPQLFAALRSFQESGANVQQYSDKCKDLLAEYDLAILPANRFLLSRPLSRYIQALELQPNLSRRLQGLIASLEACGFELSSKNWNSAVQALCQSDLEHDRLLAFEIFHNKFLTHLPTYRNLFSSTYANPVQIATGRQADVAKRKLTEHTNPGFLIPTYFTVVYLASTLKSFAGGQKDFVSKVSATFPEAYHYVNRLPYKPDRIQGVLLRGNSGFGNAIKRPRATTFVDVAGVAGSSAVVDQISGDVLDEISTKLPDPEHSTCLNHHLALEVGSAIKGEPVLGKKVLASANREESEASRRVRLAKERADRVAAAERLMRDLNLDRLTGNDYIGDPSHISKPKNGLQADETRPDVIATRTASAVGTEQSVLDQPALFKTSVISRPHRQQLESRRSLLSRTLGPKRPRATGHGRRRARRSRDYRNMAVFRANERARFMASLKVQKAALRLRRLMPRIRDLTFQARVARKQGDHARAEQFLKWAADPVFEWRRQLRSSFQNRRIWQVLEAYAPGFHDANDRVAMKMIERLIRRPGAALTGGVSHLTDTLYLRPKTSGTRVEPTVEEDEDRLTSLRPSVAKRVRLRETAQADNTATAIIPEQATPVFDPWGSTMAKEFAVLDSGPSESQTWPEPGHAQNKSRPS